ncbi:DUF3800 domain-containing protein [Frigoribacterium sp. CFBP 13729]|uniref:DUF3800 domain-containing protein n=1 Tax=Frigoribacterium sp. CFBP 13729 TaxID=2775293 RepID=UPI00177AC529|nr:DUF3800 domain-containing protein [Frigoribacterium sp. CFBP 13729]MBD8612032.1 DUF3800 domain-containing protein [Frigoribacterium sp. CFBP 13729]
MLIFYVDEFGNHTLDRDELADVPALKKGASQYFILGSVGVHDTSRQALAERIFKIKEKHFGEVATSELPWGDSEIKGRHLRRLARSVASGNRLDKPAAYGGFTSEEQASSFFKDVGLLFDTFRPIVFATVVDKLEMVRTGRSLMPLGVAYAYLHQRVATTIEDFYSGDAAMFVADQQTQHEKFFRSGGLRDARAVLDKSLQRKPIYDLVLDKPLWVDTELSHWDREILQLADIVAYSAGEYLTHGRAPAEPNYLWEQIRRCMALHQKSGRRLGAGFSMYPKSVRIPTGDAQDA